MSIAKNAKVYYFGVRNNIQLLFSVNAQIRRYIIMFDSKMTRHLAELSKLNFTDDELNKMTADMTDIIALMDKVCEFDPSVNPYALDAVDYRDLRNDNHNPSSGPEKITKNAKSIKNNSFVVPKVV